MDWRGEVDAEELEVSQQETPRIGVKVTAQVRKWENGRTPADGDPDEVVVTEHWEEADGTVITDPARIERLEASMRTE
jgi:hypothetical protein